MPFLDLRVERHVIIRERNRIHFVFQCLIGIPSRDRVRGIKRYHHIRNLNCITFCAFFRRADSSLTVKEENIVYLLENRIQLHPACGCNGYIC